MKYHDYLARPSLSLSATTPGAMVASPFWRPAFQTRSAPIPDNANQVLQRTLAALPVQAKCAACNHSSVSDDQPCPKCSDKHKNKSSTGSVIQGHFGDVVQRESASERIARFTSWGNLDEQGLGEELARYLPNSPTVVETTLNELGSSDRDDVAYYLVEKATNSQLKGSGKAFLDTLIGHLDDGWTEAEEYRQIARLKGLRQTNEESAKEVLSGLSGATSDIDSISILGQFQGKSAFEISQMLDTLRDNHKAYSTTRDGMISWLFGDLTAAHRKILRDLMLAQGLLAEIGPQLATEIYNMLGSDNEGVFALFNEFEGSNLDKLLGYLEQKVGKDIRGTSLYVFSYLDRVTAVNLSEFFMDKGGEYAQRFAIEYEADSIRNLIAWYTSENDSSAIRARFERIKDKDLRNKLLQRFSELSQEIWETSGEASLMEDMNQGDYEGIRGLGVQLGPYAYERNWFDLTLSGVEWNLIVSQWIYCGATGLVTGILSVIKEFLVGIVDTVKLAWNLVWAIVHMLSGGVAGKDNYDEVMNFFAALGQMIFHPIDTITTLWKDACKEVSTIEGPLASCRQAHLIVHKCTKALIDGILMLAGGYTAIKSAARMSHKIPWLLNQVKTLGLGRAALRSALFTMRKTRNLVKVSGEVATRLAKLLRHPSEKLGQLGSHLRKMQLAAQDSAFWMMLYQESGGVIKNIKNREIDFWKEQKAKWQKRAQEKQELRESLAGEAGAANELLKEGEAPENPEKFVQDINTRTDHLENDVSELHEEMFGKYEEPDVTTKPKTDGPETTKKVPQDLPDNTIINEIPLTSGGETHHLRVVVKNGKRVARLCSECDPLIDWLKKMKDVDDKAFQKDIKSLTKAAEKLNAKLDKDGDFPQKEVDRVHKLLDEITKKYKGIDLIGKDPNTVKAMLAYLDYRETYGGKFSLDEWMARYKDNLVYEEGSWLRPDKERKPLARFGDDLSPEQAYKTLLDEHPSFQKFDSMLKENKLATEKEILAIIEKGYKGRAEAYVRHDIKKHFRKRIRRHWNKIASNEESHEFMLKITKDLHQTDAGHIADNWYHDRYGKGNLRQVKVKKDDYDLVRDRDIDQVNVTGNNVELIEVKHYDSSFGPDVKEQILDNVELLDKAITLKGYKKQKTVNSFKLVILKPAGTKANINWLRDELLRPHKKPNITLEIFNAKGQKRTITDWSNLIDDGKSLTDLLRWLDGERTEPP